jgi:hypothetical protein
VERCDDLPHSIRLCVFGAYTLLLSFDDLAISIVCVFGVKVHFGSSITPSRIIATALDQPREHQLSGHGVHMSSQCSCTSDPLILHRISSWFTFESR